MRICHGDIKWACSQRPGTLFIEAAESARWNHSRKLQYQGSNVSMHLNAICAVHALHCDSVHNLGWDKCFFGDIPISQSKGRQHNCHLSAHPSFVGLPENWLHFGETKLSDSSVTLYFCLWKHVPNGLLQRILWAGLCKHITCIHLLVVISMTFFWLGLLHKW